MSSDAQATTGVPRSTDQHALPLRPVSMVGIPTFVQRSPGVWVWHEEPLLKMLLLYTIVLPMVLASAVLGGYLIAEGGRRARVYGPYVATAGAVVFVLAVVLSVMIRTRKVTFTDSTRTLTSVDGRTACLFSSKTEVPYDSIPPCRSVEADDCPRSHLLVIEPPEAPHPIIVGRVSTCDGQTKRCDVAVRSFNNFVTGRLALTRTAPYGHGAEEA